MTIILTDESIKELHNIIEHYAEEYYYMWERSSVSVQESRKYLDGLMN